MGKILILGDCHGSLDNFDQLRADFVNEYEFTKDDYVIVTGDFGFIWHQPNTYGHKFEQVTLDAINEYPFTTLFVDGNHENFGQLSSYPVVEWHGGRVHKIRDSVLHLMRGEVFNINDKKFFVFGGGLSVDKAYRTPYKTWWPEEEPSKVEYDNAVANLESINWQPDYIITHVMPNSYAKEFYGGRYHPGDRTSYMCNDFLLQCYGYKKWYCGHYHADVAMRPDFQICYKQWYEVM